MDVPINFGSAEKVIIPIIFYSYSTCSTIRAFRSTANCPNYSVKHLDWYRTTLLKLPEGEYPPILSSKPPTITCCHSLYRVNLIGEHIDYCGYPVLPMAVQQNIRLAVKETQDGVLHLKNVNPKYESFKCAINSFE